MDTLPTATPAVKPTRPALILVEPTPPCPSEASYGAACYLCHFRDYARYCDRCLAECDGQAVPAWITRARPDGPTDASLPMADWIEVEAERLRLNGSNLADWLADRLDDLASDCRELDASTPDEFEARSEVMRHDMDEHDRIAMHDRYHLGI